MPTDPRGPVVTALRRYPVKAMGGESLPRATLDARGLTGDRWYAVVDGDGRFATAKDSRRFRRRDEVFAYAATTGADGTVAGQPRRTVVAGRRRRPRRRAQCQLR